VRRLVALSILMAWLVAGCSMFGDAPVAPQPCGQVYSMQRCLAMTDEAASRIGRTRDDVTATDIVPDPPPPDGILPTLGGAASITVRLRFADGSTTEARMCGGIPYGAACMDAPRLEARTSVEDGGGYHDVPCPDGSPPHSCGTPLPTLQAAAVAAARRLSVARFQIPIDHLGAYEVSLGEASLANGVATLASFAFVDQWPLDVSLKDGVGQIGLRSLEPDGKPFQNYYDHGWRPGIERVEAVLVFDVLWFEKGAVLGIRDVVVR
jgi:hypothetical protein